MRKSGKGPGLSAFYKTMLETQTAGHDTVVASASAHGNTGPSLAIRPPSESAPRQPLYEPEDEYDPTLDRAASASASVASTSTSRRMPRLDDAEAPDSSAGSTRAGLRAGAGAGAGGRSGPRLGPVLHDDAEDAHGNHGGHADSDDDDDDDSKVQINDDGEVVNKRTLLRAGLNITKKPGSFADVLSSNTASIDGNANQPYVSRAVGTAASYRDRMERERNRLAENMRLEAERKKAEEEERSREEEEAARRRREGDDGQAEQRRKEAKERFLERKRQREEGKVGKDGDAKKAKT